MRVVNKTIAERFHGHPCPYCKRAMDQADFHLRATRDHHPIPRSKGGARTIIACSLCNNRKGDMTAPEWEAYMAAHPEWWKLTNRERRTKRAQEKREAERTEKWGPRGARVIRQAEKPSTPMAEPLMALKLTRMIGREFDHTFCGAKDRR
jgi:5-methylcytosine-specific restriction endonuclease McrA